MRERTKDRRERQRASECENGIYCFLICVCRFEFAFALASLYRCCCVYSLCARFFCVQWDIFFLDCALFGDQRAKEKPITPHITYAESLHRVTTTRFCLCLFCLCLCIDIVSASIYWVFMPKIPYRNRYAIYKCSCTCSTRYECGLRRFCHLEVSTFVAACHSSPLPLLLTISNQYRIEWIQRWIGYGIFRQMSIVFCVWHFMQKWK